jgi:hypothetical protein
MNAVKETIKSNLPAPVMNVLRERRDALVRAGQWPSAAFHPWRRDSIRQLAELKDIHRGKRCFLIGNGPSLKQTDLSLLKNEFTIGTNRIYLAFPELGFSTSYYLSVNDLVSSSAPRRSKSGDAALCLLARAQVAQTAG